MASKLNTAKSLNGKNILLIWKCFMVRNWNAFQFVPIYFSFVPPCVFLWCMILLNRAEGKHTHTHTDLHQDKQHETENNVITAWRAQILIVISEQKKKIQMGSLQETVSPKIIITPYFWHSTLTQRSWIPPHLLTRYHFQHPVPAARLHHNFQHAGGPRLT